MNFCGKGPLFLERVTYVTIKTRGRGLRRRMQSGQLMCTHTHGRGRVGRPCRRLNARVQGTLSLACRAALGTGDVLVDENESSSSSKLVPTTRSASTSILHRGEDGRSTLGKGRIGRHWAQALAGETDREKRGGWPRQLR